MRRGCGQKGKNRRNREHRRNFKKEPGSGDPKFRPTKGRQESKSKNWRINLDDDLLLEAG